MSNQLKQRRKVRLTSNWRRQKKYVRKKAEAIQRHGYFINCNYIPCRATQVSVRFNLSGRSLFNCEVDGESLVHPEHGKCNCSIFYCGPVGIPKKQALEMAAFYQANDFLAYAKKYMYPNMTPEQEISFIKHYDEWNWFGHKPPEGHVIPVKVEDDADANASEVEED